MQVILTEEEYVALKAGAHKEPDLDDYRKRLEKVMFPLLLDIIRNAQDSSYFLTPEQFLSRVSGRWSEAFNSVPITKS